MITLHGTASGNPSMKVGSNFTTMVQRSLGITVVGRNKVHET